MPIPFTKAHGAGNDFLLSWVDQVPEVDLASTARAICDRHTGIGADGWILIRDKAIRLFNADGSEPEISGNGTRCVAALLIDSGHAEEQLTIHTGAGPKHLRLLRREGRRFWFEMNMGSPVFETREIRCNIPLKNGAQEVTILDVGNPQCVVFVDSFPAELGGAGRGDRVPSAVSQADQRVVRPGDRRAHHRDSLLRARRGSDAEFRHRIHRCSRGRDSAESGRQPRYGPDASWRVAATALG